MSTIEEWRNRVVIVTGASAGMGKIIVERLVDVGIRVVGLAERKDLMDALAKSLLGKTGTFMPIPCAISNEEAVEKAFKWAREVMGRVDVLINCGSLYASVDLLYGQLEDFRQNWERNVLGVLIPTRAAVTKMLELGTEGHIFHVGFFVSDNEDCASYKSSMHAIHSLFHSLRTDLRKRSGKIKVTSIRAGAVAFVDKEELPQDIRDEDFPLMSPNDVVNAIFYALTTPPLVQVHELTLKPLGENF